MLTDFFGTNDHIRIMRFVRVPFGNRSSPFLLNATIKHHLKSFPFSEVVAEINDNIIYMLMTGCQKVTVLRKLLTSLMMHAQFWLRLVCPFLSKVPTVKP